MRPGSGTGLNPSQPGLWNKPGNTGNINNRPGGAGNNSGNNANINNRPGGIGNNSGNNVNINNVHNNNNWNGGGGNYWNNGGGYGHYHGDWYHGSCNGNWVNHPAAWWGAGFVSGAVVSSVMPHSWGYSSYSNPYYAEPYPVGNTVINYSQPIVMSAPADAPADPQANADPSTPAAPTAEEQASKFLGDARTSFYGEDYVGALAQVGQAIQKSPSDPVLHEFRGLVLFATKKYDQAAPTIYAVLSNGPGWDWTTLVSLYADMDTYTQQLRSLEKYRRENPQSAQARFLLAYHYLTGGHSAAALTEFKEVVKLQPTDQLSAQMVKTLTPPTAEGEPVPAPADTAVATTPVEGDKLVGAWKATQPDGSIVELTVTEDKMFSWKFTQNKKPQKFTGTSTLADNLLILRPAEGPPLVGQVAMLADNKLNFRLDANNPGDPGLTFVK